MKSLSAISWWLYPFTTSLRISISLSLIWFSTLESTWLKTGAGDSFNNSIALLAIALASNPESKVLGLVAYAWAGFGAAFGPLIILSLFWKRMTFNGALYGMIVGAVMVILWKNVWGDTGVYEIIPGFICSLVTIIVVSLMGKAPSTQITARFDEADRIYKEATK